MKIFIFLFFIIFANLLFARNPVVISIEWRGPSSAINTYRYFFNQIKNNPYDAIDTKLKIEAINKELQERGYFSGALAVDVIPLADGDLKLIFNLNLGARAQFAFRGNQLFNTIELKNIVLEKIKNEFGKVDLEQIKAEIIAQYEDHGVFRTAVNIRSEVSYGFDKEKVTSHYVEIIEGKRLRIQKTVFNGNTFFSNEELLKVFVYDKYFDKKYAENFTNILKRYYLARGFVYVEVSIPHIVYNEDGVDIIYSINEKNQVVLSEINLSDISDKLSALIKEKLINKENRPINIIALEDDLKTIISVLQDQGYYFVAIRNLAQEGLLKYDRVNSTVTFTPEIILDHKICYKETIINGLSKTKEEVIRRELDFSPGEVVTPSKVELIRQKIAGLSLFSSYKISPFMIYSDQDCVDANILIQVKEKEFGLLEITPGYRTDLGYKAGVNIQYNNLAGMNRTLGLKSQTNLRTNLDAFDEQQKKNKSFLEYSTNLSFVDPYIFHDVIKTHLEFETSASWQRKRIIGFDADIFKVSPQISKSFKSRNLNTSLKYQFEKITQYNATTAQNNNNFSIGSLTPTIDWDLRDDSINPKKGAYVQLSSEWANPYFGSMQSNDFEVNYVKITNRNKFYYSFSQFENMVLATSLALGVQKNYAKKWYIPSIKVFRLDGYDEVRGFDDAEINRLIDGRSVADVLVNDRAYFATIKFEPRYNINDGVQWDVFFDAGRIFMDSFRPLDLRASMGTGLRFLTPVGSLDFDYGIKLHRKTYPDGKADTFGRFHLSIGFF